MFSDTVFSKAVLLGGFAFLILGVYLLVLVVSVWRERGFERARWFIAADIVAFSISILFWLFWFFAE